MTSRLKRKLNDLGVDTASSKANESFCLIGTPLPPLEKSKDTGEFVPLWKQEGAMVQVRDEKGRRRLHGAFTGGFSAGYFNSVGSKEGWTPATFVSSRSERAKKKAARPEDFMDEEDLAELRESRKLVDEHEEMDFGGTAAEKRKQGGEGDEQEDSITAALAASLAPAPKDSVGARILKKMGWRVGQGIGPRLTYAQRKAQDAGFLDPSKEVEGDEEDLEEAKKHTYPRRDTPVLIAHRKDNFHGLGYMPGMGLHESVGYGAGGEKGSSGPSISGALNDADEDDIDVYDGGSGPSARNRIAYDNMLGDDEHHISIGARSAARQAARGPRAPPGITQTFNDGTPVLKGFLLSDKPVSEDRWFPLPDVPPGWQPNPKKVWEHGKNKENEPAPADRTRATQHPAQSHAAWKASQLSADERGTMLGETPLPAKTRSIFEYLSQKDRDRLQSFRTARSEVATEPSTAPRPPSPGPPPPAPGGVHIPRLHPSVAKAALSGFQPFTADPLKQSRYIAFLTYQADATSESSQNLGFGPLPGQSTDEFNKELEDYAKSATVFKPLSGAMASRFRSGAIIEMGPKVVEGLHQPTPADNFAEAGDETQEKEKEEDPRVGAVRLGMFGRLTRETVPWQPARLLCKRFGVKEPEADIAEQAGAASSGFEFATGEAQKDAGPASGPAPAMITAGTEGGDAAAEEPRSGGPRNLANVGLGEDETQGRDILTYERPAMDVFKAIFASDDEDSDDEGENENENESAPPIAVPNVLSPPPPQKAAETPAPPPPQPNALGEKIDLATFKPTFVPRSERESGKDRASEKSKEKKKDREKKRAKTTLMSFDVEDDGSIPSFGPTSTHREKKHRDRDKDGERKKKKRKEKHEEGEEDDSMWVEKPAPEVVKSLPVAPAPTESSGNDLAEDGNDAAGPQRGRKRAIDFM
ncbi:DUF1604-domain-containing protein [Lentinus tigrinus ALCF2SS1-7]|uniref:DUF1604-domain-containing protein n=1 Tax=Lentinus tigrinus ALCF2SS1-6 TaxID=1328759 RepID=A0A5C2SMH7_9APHY|nr:DUF1604-domain-containing protein [Lentinus tigrinus ALCF2SS1-6]RPD76710.1 DUF1604-domain-containing protein [Lentinus tigrinus ALCF2SS1-7]